MSLQDAFYILGIIYMSIMLLVMLVVVIAVLIIKAKINAIHRTIDEKLHTVATLTHVGEALVGKVTRKS
jgi:hypothetical protein